VSGRWLLSGTSATLWLVLRQIRIPAPVLALATVAIAFALRVYGLSELPPGLLGDEAWNLVDIIEMGETGRYPLFFANNAGREPVFIYLQAGMAVLGGVTPFAGRLTAAFVGVVPSTTAYLPAGPHPHHPGWLEK